MVTRRRHFGGAHDLSAEPIGDFVHRHPTVKMLRYSFSAADRSVAAARGLDQQSQGIHLFRDVISVFVEMINLRCEKVTGQCICTKV